jgi:photosystem II stability/assembly factor-like uncharacterized protein
MRIVLPALICTFSFFTILSSYSQSEKWEWINPKLNGNHINNVSLSPGSDVIYIGYDGGIMTSRDKGLLWTLQRIPYKIYSVFQWTPEISMGLTMDGRIIRNVLTNAPEVVYERSEEMFTFYDAYLDPETGVGICVGGYQILEPIGNGASEVKYYGVIVRTTDGGKHWNVVYEANGDKLQGLEKVGSTFIAYGKDLLNFVIRSDNGTDWSAVTNFGVGSLPVQKIAFVTDKIGFMTYDNHENLYYTRDGGENWVLRKDFDETIHAMDAYDSTIMLTTYYMTYISDDLGATWTERSIIHSGLMAERIAIGNSLIVVVDQGEGISISRDDHYNFTNVNDNVAHRSITENSSYLGFANQTIFTSPNIGYSPMQQWNNNSQLWKTTDGGCHWNRMNDYPGYDLTGIIYFLNDLVGFVQARNLYRTDDGGVTWTDLKLPWGTSIAQMQFFNESVGMAVGSDSFWRTTDGGLTWEPMPENFPVLWNVRLFMANETHAYITYGDDKILKTTDGGLTWTSKSTGLGMGWSALHFFDANNGIMAGSKNVVVSGEWSRVRTLVRTTNGGTTWTNVMDLPEDPVKIKFSSPTHGILLGNNGLYMITDDGGSTWRRENTIATRSLTDGFIFDDLTYLTGESQIIIKSKTNNPVANFEVTRTPRCENDTIVTINHSTGASNYLWKINGKEVSREEKLMASIKHSGDVLIELAAGTCNLSRYDVASATVPVLQAPQKPKLLLNRKSLADERIVCDSSYIIKPTQSYTAYEWSNKKTTSEITLGSEETISLKVFNDLGCDILSDTAILKHQKKPVAGFKIDYDLPSDEVSFINTSEGGSNFLWDLGDGTKSTERDVKHHYSSATQTYTAVLSASAWCGTDTAAQAFTITVLGTESSGEEEISFYPNPSRRSSIGHISSTTADHFSITTVSGIVVVPMTPIVDARIPVTCKEAGVYLLLLYDDARLVDVRRILVE